MVNKTMLLAAAGIGALFLLSKTSSGSALPTGQSDVIAAGNTAQKTAQEYVAEFVKNLGSNPNFRANQYSAAIDITGNPFATQILAALPTYVQTTEDLGWGLRTFNVPLAVQNGYDWYNTGGQVTHTDVKYGPGVAHIM